MPREKQTGECSVCHEVKPLFDVKNKRCGSCAGKMGGGRPTSLKTKTKNPDTFRNAPEGADGANSGGGVPEKPPKNESPEENFRPAGKEHYLCDACGTPQYYGQRKCKCGVFNDWRNTAVENDPDIVICPGCGAVCGNADQEIAACPRCNAGG